jgi:hypothetical protein
MNAAPVCKSLFMIDPIAGSPLMALTAKDPLFISTIP